ncbi:hypothetical protein P4576_15075 [Peribacillus frigoritolerans]|uniref:hypothetical protein n=1 Tax=Peribacillus frigoritolerans TaxID=450367 RepID=UPI002E248D77|nr:hypothetical protein [Peribacillus frigoritolerans]
MLDAYTLITFLEVENYSWALGSLTESERQKALDHGSTFFDLFFLILGAGSG